MPRPQAAIAGAHTIKERLNISKVRKENIAIVTSSQGLKRRCRFRSLAGDLSSELGDRDRLSSILYLSMLDSLKGLFEIF